MAAETMAALMFPLLFLFVFMGIPVAFALFATAFVMAFPVFGVKAGLQIYGGIQHTASQFILSAVPPFVFMGVMLESSGIAERLFRAMQVWMGRLRGGLALATLGMAAIIAASTGIAGAVEVVIGVMAIPIMLRYAYSRDLIAGTICAGGSLGTMIPPSIVVVIYASVANLSVGKLFAAVLLPGLLMVALFFGYLMLRTFLRPADGPPAAEDTDLSLADKLKATASGIVPAAALIAAVLGAIILGWATPTEAASVGAIGAVLLTMFYRRFSWAVLYDTLRRTLAINCMILLIVVGGNVFAGIFRLHGGNRLVQDIVDGLSLPPEGVMLLLLGLVFVAGFILDWVSVVLITLPVFLPLLQAMNADPIWFAVLMIVVIQTSYLTPPMAPSIFYLRSIAPPSITYGDMYKGVMPFIICQLLVLGAVALFPALATYLPSQMQTY